MKKNNKRTNRIQSHTPKSPKGLGDFYGQGVKAKLGKVRSDTVGMVALDKKQLKVPPKNVV
jgi:hypothetical protein